MGIISRAGGQIPEPGYHDARALGRRPRRRLSPLQAPEPSITVFAASTRPAVGRLRRRLRRGVRTSRKLPAVGHLKEHHRMGRNYLAHASGDAINAVLAAAGYNFRRLLAWLRFLLLRILIALGLAAQLKLA